MSTAPMLWTGSLEYALPTESTCVHFFCGVLRSVFSHIFPTTHTPTVCVCVRTAQGARFHSTDAPFMFTHNHHTRIVCLRMHLASGMKTERCGSRTRRHWRLGPTAPIPRRRCRHFIASAKACSPSTPRLFPLRRRPSFDGSVSRVVCLESPSPKPVCSLHARAAFQQPAT